MSVTCARMLGFISGISPESDCSKGGLERIKLQVGRKNQSNFLGVVAAAWLFGVSAAGINWEITQTQARALFVAALEAEFQKLHIQFC